MNRRPVVSVFVPGGVEEKIHWGITYHIDFMHVRNEYGVRYKTECNLWMDHHPRFSDEVQPKQYSSVSKVGIGDSFCYETGRKVALTRNLRSIARSHRVYIWDAYFRRNERPKPSWLHLKMAPFRLYLRRFQRGFRIAFNLQDA